MNPFCWHYVKSWWLRLSVCAACKKWKRGSFQAWPCGIGLSGWYSTSCFCWENTRGIFGCLLISFESRAGRQENTHFQVLCEVISLHEHTHAHRRTHSTHTCRAPSIHPSLSLPGCLHPATQLEMTHTRAHTYTHTLIKTCTSPLCSLKSHSCFLPNHCSHKTLTQTEWKLNKPTMSEWNCGSFLQEWPKRTTACSLLS